MSSDDSDKMLGARWRLEDYFPFGKAYFQVLTVSFRYLLDPKGRQETNSSYIIVGESTQLKHVKIMIMHQFIIAFGARNAHFWLTTTWLQFLSHHGSHAELQVQRLRLKRWFLLILLTIPSMGLVYFRTVYHKNQPNASTYTIYGWYGLDWNKSTKINGNGNGDLQHLRSKCWLNSVNQNICIHVLIQFIEP